MTAEFTRKVEEMDENETDYGESSLKKQAVIWLQARDIIADFLMEIPLHPCNREKHEERAATLIARLAHRKLLICTPDEMKE